MLNTLLQHSQKLYKKSTQIQARKFSLYVIIRTYRTLLLIDKMHEDLHMEFEDDLHQLGNFIANEPKLNYFALENGLDASWLITNEIPEDIAQYHKDLKAQGFLK